jgi:hypothetical protein
MRLFAVFAAAICLGGCAMSWYEAPSRQPTARLRVVDPSGGNNTVFMVAQRMSCPQSNLNPWDSEDRKLGEFHFQFSRGGTYQADERGFNRRLDMPDGSRYAPGFFAEHRIEAEKPVIFRVRKLVRGDCFVVGRAQLVSGKDYELVVSGPGPGQTDDDSGCWMALNELTHEGGGKISRVPRPFVEGPRNCEKAK